MPSLLSQLVDALQANRPVCYTALVETRGSTPQKPGAQMLIFSDGAQVGTLGGGCVEAEVKRRALALLAGGRAEILTFTLDHDYGWDDGLICGGRMKMLVDPILPGAPIDYYQQYLRRADNGPGGTEVVSIDQTASGIPEAAQLLLDRDGKLVAARGLPDQHNSAFLKHAQQGLKPISSRPRAYQAAGLAYLPQLPRCRLVIVGGGHVGQKVAELAAQVDFDVWVIDDRETYCSEERFPAAARRICAPFEDALPSLEIGSDDLCVIVTRGHQHDEEALFHLAERPARYVGMIGSRRKIRMIFEDLRRRGISDNAIERVHAPLGIDIGSQTVPEIAVSIVAELVAVRNLGKSVPRPPSG
jgi:xanthine dehydrogenase accessory factor